MPLLLDDPEPDVIGLSEGASLLPVSDGLAWRTEFNDVMLSGRAMDRLRVEWDRAARPLFSQDPYAIDGGPNDGRLPVDELNDRFGIEGVLTFDKPMRPVEAAILQKAARERQYRDYVRGNSDLAWWQSLSAGMAGAIVDPVSWPLLFAPEVLGVAKLGQLAWGARGGIAAVRAGRLANAGRAALEGAAEGVVGGVIFEAVNMPLRRAEGEDYRFGDALRNITMGAVFGAGAKGLVSAIFPRGIASRDPAARAAAEAEAAQQAAEIEALPDSRLPDAVDALPEDSRGPIAALAVERMADDAPMDMGPLLERRLDDELKALDEGPGQGRPSVAARVLEDGVAVTTRGTEIPVRYALVEIEDLVTSHDDDLVRNPDFPGALQPRERERAGAIARNRQLQSELNPRRLMREAGAESGAPIISADGVVESGNGRTIALRRAANEGTEAWDRYRAELERQGFDLDGLERPVLVRVRAQAMTGEARAALAREMNADVTERLSVTEQAMADAASLDDAALEILEAGDVGGPGNRAFARAFLARVAGDQANTLADAEGRLSANGVQRLRAAITARAYGDPRLVEAVFETADGNIKMIGQALADAAPSWARMRAAIARGQAAPELDLTANLRAAVDLVRHARDSRVPLGQLVADRLGQVEMFGGEAIAPETEAFLRLFFRDEAFKRGRAAARVAAALDDYSRRAGEIAPGPDLFGETPDAAAKRILDDLGVRLAAEPDDTAGDLLGRLRDDPPEPPRPAPEPVVLDLRPSRRDGAGSGGEGARPEGGGAAEGAERGGLTDGEPAGPAAGQDADGTGARGAGRGDGQGQGGANPAQAAPDQALEFPDQAHADLFDAGRRQLAGEAVSDAEWRALAQSIGRLIDWTDVRFVTAKVRKTFKGDLPPAAVMRRFAQDYARGMAEDPELWSLSLYDPDRIGEALAPVTVRLTSPAAEVGNPTTPPAAPAAGAGRAIIAADPELKALEESTAAFIRDEGVELPENRAQDPDVIAEGLRAAAICIKEGWV